MFWGGRAPDSARPREQTRLVEAHTLGSLPRALTHPEVCLEQRARHAGSEDWTRRTAGGGGGQRVVAEDSGPNHAGNCDRQGQGPGATSEFLCRPGKPPWVLSHARLRSPGVPPAPSTCRGQPALALGRGYSGSSAGGCQSEPRPVGPLND